MSAELKPGERIDDLQRGGLRIIQRENGFRFGTDAVLLADFAAANSETWSAKLSGSYVAISDFGKYLEKTQLTIEGNSVGIKQLYDYTAGVNNAFSVNAQQYIKTGLLYYNDVTPVYGVGVGNIETTVTDSVLPP